MSDHYTDQDYFGGKDLTDEQVQAVRDRAALSEGFGCIVEDALAREVQRRRAELAARLRDAETELATAQAAFDEYDNIDDMHARDQLRCLVEYLKAWQAGGTS